MQLKNKSEICEDQPCLLFWNIWDQFSLPAVSTVWYVAVLFRALTKRITVVYFRSVLTFMIALIVDGSAK